MASPGEFRAEDPQRTVPGYAVRPSDPLLVIPEPPQLAVQPASSYTGSVAFDAIDRTDMNAIRPNDIHMFLNAIVAHTFLLI